MVVGVRVALFYRMTRVGQAEKKSTCKSLKEYKGLHPGEMHFRQQHSHCKDLQAQVGLVYSRNSGSREGQTENEKSDCAVKIL